MIVEDIASILNEMVNFEKEYGDMKKSVEWKETEWKTTSKLSSEIFFLWRKIRRKAFWKLMRLNSANWMESIMSINSFNRDSRV
jgi:hypothetical protein